MTASRNRTDAFLRRVQTLLSRRLVALGNDPLAVDGKIGPLTEAALEAILGGPSPGNVPIGGAWPLDLAVHLDAFYGRRGDEANLVRIAAPYPMRLAWDHSKTVRSIRVNRKCAASLERILGRVLGHYGSYSAVRQARMDLFGGVFNNRRMRGGRDWSRHAWGCAIDLDPRQNGLRTPWPAVATMPEAVIEIFEAEGWQSFARTRGRDAMHFQATA